MTDIPKKIVVATKAIICCNGKYLLIRRSNTEETGAGTWEFPGGKLDFGESVEQCILREIREETGLTAEILGLAYVTDFYTSDTRKVVLINYICRADNSAVTLSDEHTAYKWVNKEEILCEIDGGIADSLRQYNVMDLL